MVSGTPEADMVSAAWTVAATTPDPELPMVTLADLGILRTVEETADGVVATITPTYSGCPAMREIGLDLRRRLERAGYRGVEIRTRLAPAWSTDWITPAGRRKLSAAGIAPPAAAARRSGPVPLTLAPPPPVTCPQCGSSNTSRTAAFSATACRSLHRCDDCREPFEAVKPL
jgi:ring-1,2-phenylacetyl-CoA epoxidase subunit PaaD